MKTTVSALVALSILTGCAGSASARTVDARQDRAQIRSQAYRNAPSSSQQFIAENRPFGSSSWWEQMDREGRGGRR
jgi:outer membrane PBP1 activator LpoA protein